MSGPDTHDDTADDHERVERELLAQDRDAHRPSTASLDDDTAQAVVRDLLDAAHPLERIWNPRRTEC